MDAERNMNTLKALVAGAWAGVIFSLLPATSALASSLQVFVSIAPQKYFVQRIGASLVNVSVLVPPGADPHTYEPKPRQMVSLSGSALYFAVGVDFEKAWLKKIAAAHPRMRIIPTDEGIAKIPMTAGHRHENAEGRQGRKERHPGTSPDPHVWLAPNPVKIQAAHIAKALAETDPKNRSQYAAGYDSFVKELDSLDAELKALFAGRKGERFLAFHPAWGYFAAAYGLQQETVELEGKELKAAQLQTLIRRARDLGVKVVFAQPQSSAKGAEMVAREIGGQVVVVDPLAEDWGANMRTVADKFRAALK